MRLAAAVAVIFSHAFLIATGTEDGEPLVQLLGPGNIAGLYGVFTFFIISGFLLARSLSTRPSAVAYAVNRTLRILPGYVLSVLVVALAIGPLCSALAPHRYFSPAVARYVGYTVNSLGDSTLPGVYAYQGTFSSVVNGSLWSLRYEALSYVLLLLLWTLLRGSGRVAVVIVALAVATRTSPLAARTLASVAYTLPYFAGGVAMYWVYQRSGTHRAGAIVAAALFTAGAAFGLQSYLFAGCGAYLIVFFAERPNPGSRIAARIGDCSYGLYLYGWPAEQVVKQLTATANPWLLFALSLPLALGLALVSFHLVERPAVRGGAACIRRLRAFQERLQLERWPAVAGAKAAFVIGAVLLLSSRRHWWYVLESVGELVLAAGAGAVVALAAAAVARRLASDPVADLSERRTRC